MIFISIFFILSNHPFYLIISIFLLCISISFFFTIFSKYSWIRIIIIILFIRGLIILFLYIIRLLPNFTLFYNFYTFKVIIITFLFIITYDLFKLLNSSRFFSITYIFNNFISINYILCIHILFIYLIFIIEFTTYIFSPLRSLF